MIKDLEKKITFKDGKLVNSLKLDLKKNKNLEDESMPSYSEFVGKVLSKTKKRYYVSAIIKIGNKKTTFRVYDLDATLFYTNIKVGDMIKGTCSYNLKDTRDKYYNKIKTYETVTDKKVTFVMEGTITNLSNSRDPHKENMVSFCFKPFNSKTVDFIQANDIILNSSWFRKDSKVRVETFEEKRTINFPNRTLKMVTMWSLES